MPFAKTCAGRKRPSTYPVVAQQIQNINLGRELHFECKFTLDIKEGLIEVGDDVFYVFDTDGQAN